jgi:hypothetical protein
MRQMAANTTQVKQNQALRLLKRPNSAYVPTALGK